MAARRSPAGKKMLALNGWTEKTSLARDLPQTLLLALAVAMPKVQARRVLAESDGPQGIAANLAKDPVIRRPAGGKLDFPRPFVHHNDPSFLPSSTIIIAADALKSFLARFGMRLWNFGRRTATVNRFV